jgi:ectoine hydroxylase-related dioxygenase (phytanoyl-CoA dioxygenase family)
MGAQRIVLTHALAWTKCGGIDDYDQALHVDAVAQRGPVFGSRCEQAGVIIYLTDMTGDNGPTYVVPRRYTRALPLTPAVRSRHVWPGLYRHERPVRGSAGLMLIYDMNTVFHRGSLSASRRGRRLSLHLIYRAAELSPFDLNRYTGLGVIL